VVVAGIYLVDVDHAVVVGAGIGGLAASLALSRVAARVTLVERAERPSEVGAALALQPNGMAVLDRLGLLLAVEAVSARIDRMDIRSVTGQRLLSARMPDLGDGLDHAIAVRRVELHRLLLEAVAGVASIDTRFGWTAVSADPSGAVMITSTAENGPDFGSMSLRADVVVGADGVNSAVRSTGGFVSRVSSASSYVRTIVRGRANPWFEEYWTPLGSFGHAPLGDDLVYFWAAAHAAEAAEATSRRDLAAFNHEWREVLPAAADLLERVSSFDDLLVNTVRRVDCRRWFSGHLVLLGDAAHAMAPEPGPGSQQRSGRRCGPHPGTRYGTVGDECPGGVRQTSPCNGTAPATDGRAAPTAVPHRTSCRTACAGRRARQPGSSPRTQRGGRPSQPGHRYPSRQIRIRTRRPTPSPSEERRSSVPRWLTLASRDLRVVQVRTRHGSRLRTRP